MPREKSALPQNVIDAVEKWALKNCNTDPKASEVVDHRIKRVCTEIQSGWTEAEERMRRVAPEEEYLARCYRVLYEGAKHNTRFNPDRERQ